MIDVVTGGGGFIGSHLVDRLLAAGRRVRVLDNFSTGRRQNLDRPDPAALEILEGDVCDEARLDEAFQGAERVFHLAARADIVPSIQEPREYFRSNVDGTFATLEAARRHHVARYVYVASSSCYGLPDELPTPEEFAPYARASEPVYFSFYESTLALYTDQYRIFGDPEVMPVKVLWDYTYYWGVLAQIWYQGRLTDLNSLSRLRAELAQAKALNFAVQRLLRAWSLVSGKRESVQMLDQASLPWFAELNRSLLDPPLDDAAYRARLRGNVQLLKALALEIVGRARADAAGIDAAEVEALARGATPEGALLFGRAA